MDSTEESESFLPTEKRKPSFRLSKYLTPRFTRRLLRLLPRFLLIITIVPLLYQLILAYILPTNPHLLPPSLRQAKNLLIVTAHPDDECLFFSPSILATLDDNPTIKGGLVVLSTGNNYGLGELRAKELLGSCGHLGIDKDRCLTLDRPGLQDNPKLWWKEKDVLDVVKEYVKKWDIDVILTFDEGGSSGHINHRAVSAAISHYAATDPSAPTTYLLGTPSLWRKYTVMGDLPLTSLRFLWRILGGLFTSVRSTDDRWGDKALVASSWGRYLRTRWAFASHGSQYSWDRVLYLVLARVIWFNDLVRVERVVAGS